MKKEKLRKCVGCNKMIDRKKMIRISKTKEGNFSIDHQFKKDGRGAYMCKEIKCYMNAKKNSGIERSFKMKVPIDVYKNLEREVEFKNV